MKSFQFSHDEMNALLMSLIQRRNNINALLNIQNTVESYRSTYLAELATVEGLLERFFPGSLERIKSAA